MPIEYVSPLHLLKAKIDFNLNMAAHMSDWSQMTGLDNSSNLYSDHIQLIWNVWPVQVRIVKYMAAVGMNHCRLPQYIEL